jgi:hypothetical protein
MGALAGTGPGRRLRARQPDWRARQPDWRGGSRTGGAGGTPGRGRADRGTVLVAGNDTSGTLVSLEQHRMDSGAVKCGSRTG